MGCKPLSEGMKSMEFGSMVDKASKEARAKYVPAAAVTRTGRTLFGITGLKGYVGGQISQM